MDQAKLLRIGCKELSVDTYIFHQYRYLISINTLVNLLEASQYARYIDEHPCKPILLSKV